MPEKKDSKGGQGSTTAKAKSGEAKSSKATTTAKKTTASQDSKK